MFNETNLNKLRELAEKCFFAVEDYSTELTGLAGEWDVVKETEKGAELLREYRKAQKAYDDTLDECYFYCYGDDNNLEAF